MCEVSSLLCKEIDNKINKWKDHFISQHLSSQLRSNVIFLTALRFIYELTENIGNLCHVSCFYQLNVLKSLFGSGFAS